AGRVLLPAPAAAPQWRAAGRHCAPARRRAPGHPPAVPTRASHRPGDAPPQCDVPRPCAAPGPRPRAPAPPAPVGSARQAGLPPAAQPARSEEHTSELQSLAYLVCRLLLEKKKFLELAYPAYLT